LSLTISGIPRSSDWRGPARLGYLVIFLTFGIGGGWAAIAKISSAVVAEAFVSVETNSKSVQHLEGGIIGQILVKEAQHVDQGQTVLRLSDIEARASLVTVQNQLVAARTQEARLLAERDQKSAIDLPDDIRVRMNTDPVVEHAVADQNTTFEDRQRSLRGQTNVLESRIQGYKTEIQGLMIEEDSTKGQLGYIRQELVGLHDLLSSHLVPLSRVLALERERTRLQGVIGRSIADQAKAQNAVGETELNIQQLRQKVQEETAAGIIDIRQKIADLHEKLTVTSDVMHRIDIRSPVSGQVQNLKIYAVGQVIRAGEPLMEVVPDEERLIVQARFSPIDIDRVQRATDVEVRFPSFHSRTTPTVLGTLASVSADRMTDETTHQPYYLGVVRVDKLQIPEELRERLRAGMPAEVIAPLGERSVLSYLISPLREAWRKSLREE
jgi:HlyD family secretion protein